MMEDIYVRMALQHAAQLAFFLGQYRVYDRFPTFCRSSPADRRMVAYSQLLSNAVSVRLCQIYFFFMPPRMENIMKKKKKRIDIKNCALVGPEGQTKAVGTTMCNAGLPL